MTTQTNDKWVKCIAQSGHLHATSISAINLIEEARKRHGLAPVETKALGEALMAGLLLASTSKAGERVSLSLKGEKFFRQCIVDANPSGTVRGFVISKELESDIDVTKGPWQTGLLSVVRLKLHEKEPYVGTVPLVTGYLAKDLTFYLSQSEQIPSAVGLAVNLEKDGSVKSAGAFLVQVMPGAGKDVISALEKNINSLESMAHQVESSSNPTVLLGQIFDDMTFQILEEKPLLFECTCSRERIVRAFQLIGIADLQKMIVEDHGAEVSCDFCGKQYKFSEDDLIKIRDDQV